MTTAQVFSNGVQLGCPQPPAPYQGLGGVQGPPLSLDEGLAFFVGSSGKQLGCSSTTVDINGGLLLAGGAATVPIPVPTPNPTPFGYYEMFEGFVDFAGPWFAANPTGVSVARIGDRFVYISFARNDIVSSGSAALITAPPGSIPANFCSDTVREASIPVFVGSAATFSDGYFQLMPDGSIIISADTNTTLLSTFPAGGTVNGIAINVTIPLIA